MSSGQLSTLCRFPSDPSPPIFADIIHRINATANTPNICELASERSKTTLTMIGTSYLYGDHGPHYTIAFSVDLAASVLVIVFAAATYLYLRRQNAKIERGEKLGKSGPTAVQIEDGFRYQL